MPCLRVEKDREDRGAAPGPVEEWEEAAAEAAAAAAREVAVVEVVRVAAVPVAAEAEEAWETVPARAPAETVSAPPAERRSPIRPACPASAYHARTAGRQ